MRTPFKICSVLTAMGMFLVVMMGALVTKTGSGNGCGDSWPLCNGRFAPMENIQSLIEYSHRAVSGTVGILVLITFILALRSTKDLSIRWLAFSGLFFTIVQAGLGAMAVVWQQSSAVLALHLGFSLLAFASTLLVAIYALQLAKPLTRQVVPVSARYKYATWLVTLYTYGVVYVGAYVRHTGAGLGCTGWPLCNGEVVPTLTGLTGIQFIHRVAAALCFLAIAALAFVAWKNYRIRTDIRWGSFIAFVLVFLQVISGGFIVLSGLSLVFELLHTAIISALFGMLTYLCLQVRRL